MLQTIAWTGQSVRLLDQTKLPIETVFIEVVDEKQMWDAIKRLVVRGAPAIGVAGAFGVYLGIRNFANDDPSSFNRKLSEVCDYLASARPTAVNLFWAIDRVKRASNLQKTADEKRDVILRECLTILEEDQRTCRLIGENGLTLLLSIKPGASAFSILTHCNAGSLATAGIGTALAPIYVGVERGLKFQVYSDETRPLLQGSRLTAFELRSAGVPVTVLCDNMAAALMSKKKIDAVIVGADRIAANGDAANKIGTFGLAILAKHFAVPFFVAAPTSTIDPACPTGAEIPIEQRDSFEITHGFGKQTAPGGVDVFNPAFDVTPAALLTAIITEAGVLRPPFQLRGN